MKEFKHIIITITCLLWLGVANAQQKKQNTLDYLQVTWELIQNNFENKNNQFLAQLSIKNTSKHQIFPAQNWTMYFSYPREFIRVIDGDVNFQVLQGDFRSMQPSKNFKPLAPGQELVIKFVAKGKTQNISDAISGMYAVIDNQALPINNFVAKPVLNSGINKLSAQHLYAKYEHTVDLPDTAVRILPSPATMVSNNQSFTLNANVSIHTDQVFLREANFLAQDLKTVFGREIKISTGNKIAAIRIEHIAGLSDEAYELEVTNKGIVIKATAAAGAFYAVKSVVSLFPGHVWAGKSKPFVLRGVKIKDQPRFGYRAFMMDVSRNFQPKAQVKKVIDLMSMYKLNTLHFHINDDEGWRLEIPSLPELTEVGATRAHTFTEANLQPSYGSGAFNTNKAGTGYYSKADFIEILKYAAERHIHVIPEIETPGHARAAIKSMNYRYQKYMAKGDKKGAEEFLLVDLKDKSKHKSVQGFTDNIMNVALPSTYRFIEKVVDEMSAMYAEAGLKLKVLHLGGDEVPNGTWAKSEAVNQLIKSKTIENVDDLWYYYFGQMSNMLKSKQIKLAGWEEIALRKTKLDGKNTHIVNADFVKENFNVYVWNTAWGRGSEDLAYRLANAGYKTVLGSVSNFYFDLAYSTDYDESGLYWGGFVDVDKPFYFVPFDNYKMAKENHLGQPVNKQDFAHKERLTDFGKKNILGIQSLLWSEKVTTGKQLEYMLFPKLLGFAERAWATSPDWAEERDEKLTEEKYNAAWSLFATTLGKKELPRLDFYHGGVNYRIPPVGLKIQNGMVYANVQFPGLQIRYTTNGTVPTVKSNLYTKEIPYSTSLNFKAFSKNGRSSKTSKLN